MVSEIVKANPGLRLMPVICLVDLTIIENPRLQLIPIYSNQISKADIIAFSKCDLLTDSSEKERLVRKFNSLFPAKQFCIDLSDFGQFATCLDPDLETKAEGFRYRMIFPSDPALTDGNYLEKILTFGADVIFDLESFALFFKNQTSVIRAKGHINTPKGWNLFNFSFSGCNFEPCGIKTLNEIIVITEKTDSVSFQKFDSEIKMNINQNALLKV